MPNDQVGQDGGSTGTDLSQSLIFPSANKLAGWNNERVKAEMSLPQSESNVLTQSVRKTRFKEVCILMKFRSRLRRR